MRRWLIPGVLVLLGLVHLSFYWWFWFDDLYITLRYGRNLAEGVGLRYNPGETVDGFSSFSWVLVSAFVELVGLRADVALKVLCSGAALALVVWTYREILVRVSMSRWTAAMCALVVVATPGWAYWSMTAMETMPFVLLIFGATIGLAGEARDRWWPGVLLGIAALTRPEGIGYVVALTVAVATVDRRAALRTAAGALTLFAPYFVWHWWHFGYPLPNTYYAKHSTSGGVLWRGIVVLEEYFTSRMVWLLVAGSVWTVVTRWRHLWVRPLAAVAAAAPVNVIFVGGDTFLFHRFSLPALAPMLILSAVALGDLGKRFKSSSPRSELAVAGIAFCLAAWMASSTVRVPVAFLSKKDAPPIEGAAWSAGVHDDYRIIGRWMKRNFPPGTWLATNAAGIIPYESGLPTIDMLGLSDQHIAHREVELGRGTTGHEKHDADYVLGRRPDVILLGVPQFTAGQVRNGDQLHFLHARWFPYLPGDRLIFFHPEFRANYVPRSVVVGRGQWLTLFIRKDRVAVITGQ